MGRVPLDVRPVTDSCDAGSACGSCPRSPGVIAQDTPRQMHHIVIGTRFMLFVCLGKLPRTADS